MIPPHSSVNDCWPGPVRAAGCGAGHVSEVRPGEEAVRGGRGRGAARPRRRGVGIPQGGVFTLSKQISIPSISEDKLAVHLLVQAALADVVQGSEGGLLHLDLQLPKAGGGGPQVTHTQGAQGPLPQAEQQHHHEGYIQVDVETNIQLDIFCNKS